MKDIALNNPDSKINDPSTVLSSEYERVLKRAEDNIREAIIDTQSVMPEDFSKKDRERFEQLVKEIAKIFIDEENKAS